MAIDITLRIGERRLYLGVQVDLDGYVYLRVNRWCYERMPA